MASTNKTTNYQLSQFQSSDIPAWLTDYNGDMQKIDAGIHAAKTQADGAATGVSLLQTAVSGKQDTLTFDSAPIAGSANPVTSGGIYNALQNAQIQTDAVPTEGSTKAVQSGGVYTALQGKQGTLTFDETPTQNSQNPVTSGGVFTALAGAGAPAFNSAGNFLNRSNQAYPRLRYLFNPVNKSFFAMFSGGAGLSFVGSAWIAASDSTFPSLHKLFYIAGNPFGLTANPSYPVTQNEMASAIGYSLGIVRLKNSNSEDAACYLKMLYVAGENRTYIVGQMNEPDTTRNQNGYTSIMCGDLRYTG